MEPDAAGREWLEADGLGGFASGTASGVRTRRYHALLLAAASPPTGRVALVNGVEAWVETEQGSVAISAQRYAPGVTHPDGASRLVEFARDPWPAWTYALPGGARVRHEVFARRGAPLVALSWRLEGTARDARLGVRLLLSGRDYHALHRENSAFRLEPEVIGERLVWRPYQGLPRIACLANGDYRHDPVWYRGFLYEQERERGLDCVEDLASPGVFRWDLARGEAVLILSAGDEGSAALGDSGPVDLLAALRASERERRSCFPTRLHRAADAYVVRRGEGKSMIAGYPWFTDWGRDTFIALRGLCVAGGRLDDAIEILLTWSSAVVGGMLPNRFPDQGAAPEFGSVDASLWFVVALREALEACEREGRAVSRNDRARLVGAASAILGGYSAGTRFGIRADHDGLLAAGEPGRALTWMDARIGDRPVTPRIGKPVEIQALWLNALAFGETIGAAPTGLFARGRGAFLERFWNEAGGALHDVVDVDHRPGTSDASFRPNQIFAVGGLPLQILRGERARRIVDAVEARLWTPLGLRSLAPGEPGYAPRYAGGPAERDGAYHQGTVWPWLAGAFVEAWVRVRGGGAGVKREARERFLAPLLAHLDVAGLGHLPEIADAEAPHAPRGCPFQAWSLGEALRLDRVVLAE